MIKLEIEKDMQLHKSEMRKINRKISGIYFLLDENKKPLYIGETQCVRTRVDGHLLGCTNAKEFHERIEYIEFIIEPDKLKRKFLERYLIAITEGVLNSKRDFEDSHKVKVTDFHGVRVFGPCRKEGCKNHADSNGYCHKHGGNGISRRFIQIKAIEDFLRGRYTPSVD